MWYLLFILVMIVLPIIHQLRAYKKKSEVEDYKCNQRLSRISTVVPNSRIVSVCQKNNFEYRPNDIYNTRRRL